MPSKLNNDLDNKILSENEQNQYNKILSEFDNIVSHSDNWEHLRSVEMFFGNILSQLERSPDISIQKMQEMQNSMSRSQFNQMAVLGAELSAAGVKEQKGNHNVEEKLSEQEKEGKPKGSPGQNLEDSKQQVKVNFMRLLETVIANKMDPTQRAGETVESNIKGAEQFGRGKEAKEHLHHEKDKDLTGSKPDKEGVLGKLLDVLLKALEVASPVTAAIQHGIEKGLEEKYGKNEHANKNQKEKGGMSLGG